MTFSRSRIILAAIAIFTLMAPALAEPIGFSASGAQAQAARSLEHHSRHHHARTASRRAHGPSQAVSGPGIVRSAKTGATAHVAARFAAVFQSYVDALEAAGATVRFMGGYRPGPCASWSEHPCGKALDVCQLARGVVDARCHLPGRATMIAIANRLGLQEGGEWCSSDRGHAQIDRTAARCGQNLYSAVAAFKAKHTRHHHIHYARR